MYNIPAFYWDVVAAQPANYTITGTNLDFLELISMTQNILGNVGVLWHVVVAHSGNYTITGTNLD